MKNIIYFLIVFGSLTACGQAEKSNDTASEKAVTPAVSKETLAGEIKTLEDKLLAIKDASKDTLSASAMIEKTELYVQEFPADSLSPFLLFRAGDVARGAGKTDKAIQLWDSVWRNYEDHRLAPGSLFAQAFTFDAQLGNKKEADRYYRKFVHKYPDHQLVDQVKQLLRMINKSPEELVREFKEKNKE